VKRANETLAEYQQMHHWFVWPDDAFPRTSTQKPRTNVIQQAVLSKLGSKPADGSSSPLSASNSLADLIARVTGRQLPNSAGDAELEKDLNLTSLDQVELMGALEDRYQLDLSETSFAALRTVGDLESLLHASFRRALDITIPAGCRAGPQPGSGSSLITCYCVPRFCFWVGRESKAGRTCATFEARFS